MGRRSGSESPVANESDTIQETLRAIGITQAMQIPVLRRLITLLLIVATVQGAHAAAPKGWRQPEMGSRLAEVGIDRTVAHSGKASAFVRASATERTAFGICRQWVRAHRYRGKRLRVSAYLKTAEVGPTRRSGARMDLFLFSETHRIGGAAMRGRLIQGTTPWTKYEHVIDVPPEASLLAVDISLAGPGQVWVDDVRLEVVGPNVPTTASIDRRAELSEEFKQRVQTRLREAPRKPVNLDFEQ